MLPTSTRKLLQEIQCDETERMYIHVTERAVEWAVAGLLDEANQLLEVLWGYGYEHSGHLWLLDQGFQVIWEVSGTRPANIPFSFTDIKDIETENWSRVFYPPWDVSLVHHTRSQPYEQLDGTYLFIKTLDAACGQKDDVQTILSAFNRVLHSDYSVGYSYFHVATCGALYAAKFGFLPEAMDFLQLWGDGYLKYPENFTLSYLMRDRSTAKLLLTGSLAPLFGLSKEICERDLRNIEEVLDQRFVQGRTLVYGDLSWKALLQRIPHVAIDKAVHPFTEDAIQSGYLGYSGAIETEIEQAEKRLGVKLPEDYKAFLRASNGFPAYGYDEIPLLPVEQVDYYRNIDKDMVDTWLENTSPDHPSAIQFRNAVLIGGAGQEQQLLLIPVENDQWECSFFAVWSLGETRYPNFRFYVEEQLQELENENTSAGQ